MEDNKFNFSEYDKPEEKPKVQEIINPALSQEKEKPKRIAYQEMPKDTNEILNLANQQAIIDKFTKEEPIAIPYDNTTSTSYLNLVLSPNLRELEMMIRGIEYVKRYNPLTNREEVILRKIIGHPLNEYGVNQIMQELRVFSSPEIKLGRKAMRDYYNSVNHVCHTIVRLVYKNLRNFGMDTQVKQRNAKVFCDAVIEIIDASFSRSIEGKENDLSRATEFKIEGNVDALNDPAKYFNKPQKEQLKN